jgi:hypothetical protein
MDLLFNVTVVIAISIYAATGMRVLSAPSLYKPAGIVATPAEVTFLFVLYYAALFITLFAFFRRGEAYRSISGKRFTALAVSATAICFFIC